MEESVPSLVSQQVQEADVRVGRKFSKNKIFKIAIAIVFFLLLASVIYIYSQYQKSQNLLNNPSASADAQGKEVITAVGKLLELPTNEQPTIATVSDKTKLANEPFFAKAQNGDKVLVYSLNKEVILYRPSLNKIISIGTVNLAPSIVSPQPVSSAQAQPTSVATPSPSSTAKPTPTSTVIPVQ